MNLSLDMIPGLCVLLAGAMIAYFAKWLCRKPQNVPQIKLLGTGMAIMGAILIFLP
ncbi:MAG: hypothetical protein Q4F18_04670 [Clostridia bacterium]|nr:hypothetical protein [Clostridia bacterium]